MADLVISLDTTDDLVVEGLEAYTVALSTPGSPTGANIVLGTSSVITTITDNDTNTIAVGPVTVNEAAGTLTFTVTQTGTTRFRLCSTMPRPTVPRRTAWAKRRRYPGLHGLDRHGDLCAGHRRHADLHGADHQ